MAIKVCYIYQDEIPQSDEQRSGVDRKALSQIKAFRAAGFRCQLAVPKLRKAFFYKVAQLIPFGPNRYDWVSLSDLQADVFYIRRPLFFSRQLIKMLGLLKLGNPTCKILFEIPTYPYDDEFSSLILRIILAKDRYCRKRIHTYVDRIVDLSGVKSIFGVPAIRIMNGVDLSKISPRRADAFTKNGVVNIIVVASFSHWHGLDRLVAGLCAYYASKPCRKVVLHMVGEGPDRRILEDMVKDHYIDDYVCFYGQCGRAEMDRVYDQCSLAVECLGNHRKGITLSSSLKSREYLAKGIPFVYSGRIDVFEKRGVDFCLQVPDDESPIDIESVLAFHDTLYARESEKPLTSRIRTYAEENVGMDAAMKPVVDYIKESFGQ